MVEQRAEYHLFLLCSDQDNNYPAQHYNTLTIGGKLAISRKLNPSMFVDSRGIATIPTVELLSGIQRRCQAEGKTGRGYREIVSCFNGNVKHCGIDWPIATV